MSFRIQAARLLALASAILFVPACGGGDDDDPALVVTFTSPISLQGDVPRQPVIYVRFNRPLDPATVTTGTFILLNSVSAIIPASVTYESCMNEVRVVPSAALTKSATYQLSLTTGIKDTDDMAYGGGFFQFTIGAFDDADRPSFSGATSAGSPTSTSIAVGWAVPATDPTSGFVYDIFLSTTSDCYDFTDPFLADQTSVSGVTVTMLSNATTYYFVVRARDSEGNVDLNEAQQTATTLP